MELDCTCADNVVFDKIIEYDQIKCVIGESRDPLILDYFGRLQLCCPKCVIFPKGKTTWKGFQRPFKDGDVVFCNDNIAIFKEWGDATLFRTYVKLYIHRESIDIDFPLFGKYVRKETRFATEKEKEKLFKAIKENGYRWNAEKKELESLIVPKFKVGDRIKSIISQLVYTIKEVRENAYLVEEKTGCFFVPFCLERNYELVPNKFDISTLKPFKSEVLVRHTDIGLWRPAIFGFISDNGFGVVGGNAYEQCIPYKGNEHLMGKFDDCDEYYKTWK